MATTTLVPPSQAHHAAGAPPASTSDPERVLGALRPELAQRGFGIAETLQLSWYNRAQEEPAARIPEQGSAGSRALCVLVGNCKLLWPAFLAACAADDSLMSAADPLDTYTESSLDALAQPRSCVRVLYAHDEHAAGSAYVGMQLLAEVAGIAYHDALSHLSLHPRYGSWWALRALIVFDNVVYEGERRPPLPNPMDKSTQQYVRMAVRSARTSSCAEVSSLGDTDEQAEAEADAMRRRWRKWVAVREAPCSGHSWRYSDSMMEYHYTTNPRVLRQAVQAHKAQHRISGDIVRSRSFSRPLED